MMVETVWTGLASTCCRYRRSEARPRRPRPAAARFRPAWSPRRSSARPRSGSCDGRPQPASVEGGFHCWDSPMAGALPGSIRAATFCSFVAEHAVSSLARAVMAQGRAIACRSHRRFSVEKRQTEVAQREERRDDEDCPDAGSDQSDLDLLPEAVALSDRCFDVTCLTDCRRSEGSFSDLRARGLQMGVRSGGQDVRRLATSGSSSSSSNSRTRLQGCSLRE